MTLYVFEGKKRESEFFNTLEKLYPQLQKNDKTISSFCNNIYNLYKEMTKSNFEEHILYILKQHDKNNQKLALIDDPAKIDSIYLFFDYDPQNQKSSCSSLNELNNHLIEMLNFFDNETENGKLYISYPMVEALRYTKKLPDMNFHKYAIKISDLMQKNFKQIANDFSYYKKLNYISLFCNGKISDTSDEKLSEIKQNWDNLKMMHIEKANFLCNGKNTILAKIEEIAQDCIFKNQISKYIVNDEISVLCSYPLFLYEYLGK